MAALPAEPDRRPALPRLVQNDAGDTVAVNVERGAVHLEVASEGREPVEVWLSPADARFLAALLERAAGG
jgi:hypothetical protein